MDVVVLGQVGRDLALSVPRLPKVGGSASVAARRERLGGKGANQAVGLAQLGVPVSLVGVVGSDVEGATVLREATDDGIDVTHVDRRGRTALLATLVEDDARRRLLEDVPEPTLLTVADVERASMTIGAADTVAIQLQQPHDAVLAATHRARQAAARVVTDGAVEPETAKKLLPLVDVLRADAKEAEILADQSVGNAEDALTVARRLLDAGPGLVALAIPDNGNLLAWPGGHQLFPHADVAVVDPTGAGDAFVAGLIAALRKGASPVDAGQLATKAAAATVGHLGGRPDLASLARELST